MRLAAVLMAILVVGSGCDSADEKSTNTATIGAARVSIIEARIGKPKLRTSISGGDEYAESDIVQLIITIEIENTSETQKIDYQSWRGVRLSPKTAAILKDDLGNNYKRTADGSMLQPEGGTKGETSLYPKKTLRDVILFESPIDKAKSFKLELPGVNVGAEGKSATLSFNRPL